jgi:hypothetical protein
MKKSTLVFLFFTTVFLGCNGLLYTSSKREQLPISGRVGVPYPNLNYFHIDGIAPEEKERITQVLQDQIIRALSKLTQTYAVEFVPMPLYSKQLQDLSQIQEKYGVAYVLTSDYTFLDYDSDLESLLLSVASDFTLFPSEGKYKIHFSLSELKSQNELWNFKMKGSSSKVGVSNMMFHPRRELKKVIVHNKWHYKVSSN